MIPFALMAVNMTIAPTVSKLYTEGDLQKIQCILTISARAMMVFSLPAALVLIIFGPWLVPFVFGEDFAFAAYPLAILCIGQLMNVCMGSVGLVLNMTGYEKDTARGVAIAAVVNIILNIALIPYWGVIGAAIATSAALFIWNILLTYWVYKRTGLHTTALGRLKRS